VPLTLDWTHLGFGWAAAACFGLTVASAVFPWIVVEVIVLALPAVAHSPRALLALLIVATLGQMTGKAIVYWIGRGCWRWSPPRLSERVERWRGRFDRGSRGAGVVFLSSSVGWPPFFAVAAVAGALKVHFPTFMAAGAAGRLIRFGALIFVPQAIAGWIN
jgi:membrane protein YqaA with SNARE-associated domain